MSWAFPDVRVSIPTTAWSSGTTIKPENLGLDKMAFTLTGDLGCEYGGSASRHRHSCQSDKNGHPKQSFAGWMLYNRFWFHKDLFAMTIGGGAMDNPGRYLTLLPPINGATSVSGSPYFPEAPGLPYKAWDSTITFDYMPSQFITFRFETGYRYASVPYFSGREGITPPGGNVGPVANNGSVGTASSYLCTNGTTSAVSGLFAVGKRLRSGQLRVTRSELLPLAIRQRLVRVVARSAP